MNAKRLTLALLAAALMSASGAHAAGFRFLDVPADSGADEIHGAIWSPCASAPDVFTLGPFDLEATRNCPIAGENRPLVIMSHGRGGSFLNQHDLAEALADAGFVVVAINHPGDNALDRSKFYDPSVYVSRPIDIRRTLDFVLEHHSLKASIDPHEIGFVGFSRGGYTGLVLAGATPDWAPAKAICATRREPICDQVGALPPPPANREPRISAFVFADPLILFSAEGLKGVTAPVQFWSSEFGGDGVTPQSGDFARAALPVQPEAYEVKGAGHFAFIAPCSAALAASAPAICADAPGFDRATFHQQMNAAVVAFFKRTLGKPQSQ